MLGTKRNSSKNSESQKSSMLAEIERLKKITNPTVEERRRLHDLIYYHYVLDSNMREH